MYLQGAYKNLFRSDKDKFNDGFIKSKGFSNVLALGGVSFFTDISSEMVLATIPLYLTTSLGFTILAFGLFEGAYQLAGAFFRLWGGTAADTNQSHKKIALYGYSLSAFTRLALYASTFFASAMAIPFLIIDKVGKGIRVAPRDALISLSVKKNHLATAFGLHRSLDTLGALIGPFIAYLLLEFTPGSFDTVFFVATISGFIGVIILYSYAKQPKQNQTKQTNSQKTLSIKTRIRYNISNRSLVKLLVAVALLSMTTVSDSFLFLYVLKSTDMRIALFPLLFSGIAITYLILAIPIGKLSDKMGRKKIFLMGYLFMIGAYLTLANSSLSLSVIIISLAAVGIYYACTDGVISAIASSISKAGNTGTTLGMTSMTIAVFKLFSAAAFGILWELTGNAKFALNVFAVAMIAALVTAFSLLKDLSKVSG